MQLNGIIEWTTTHYAGANDIDLVHLAAITTSMEADGWVGAPLVVDGDQAVTGSHRLRAADLAGLDRVPVVKAADLADAYGIDWDELLDASPNPTSRWYDAAQMLVAELPAGVVAHLGLDQF